MANVPRYRISICRGPDCRRNGAERVLTAAREATQTQGLEAKCLVARGGCYGLCHLGPNVVVREDTGKPKDPFSREDFELSRAPGETYYWVMQPAGIERVVREHIVEDKVVKDLVGDPDREDDFRFKRNP